MALPTTSPPERGRNLAKGSRDDVDLVENVRRARRGDTLAMSALIDAATPYLGRLCGAIALGDGDDALQEVLIAVFQRLHTLREPEAFWGWLRTLATREALRFVRGRAALASAMTVSLSDVEQWYRQSGDFVQDVEVRQALEGLAAEQRSVLYLRLIEGLSEAEVADALGVATGTAKSRLSRARLAFSKRWRS
jgi:RNA polymerase sigma factor (sigma-70 family)